MDTFAHKLSQSTDSANSLLSIGLDPDHRKLPPNVGQFLFNQAIINNSYIKSIATKKERIEQVLDNFDMAFPSQIFAGGNPAGYVTGAIKKKEVFFFEIDKQVHELLEFMQFTKYKNLGRNDRCACNSGKKFKRCHGEAYERLQIVIQGFGRTGRESRRNFGIPGVIVNELPVDHWSGFSEPKEEQ